MNEKQDNFWAFWAGVARQEAAGWLRDAAELLEGQGPSLWSQMFGGHDAPDWRRNEAQRYMAKAREALLRARALARGQSRQAPGPDGNKLSGQP